MPSTFTSNTGIEKIGDGEQTGTWGDTTNLNFDIVDRALNGSVSIVLSGTTHTLTTSDGVLSDGQYAVLVFTGSPSGTNTVTIDPNTAQKTYIVRNATAQSVVLTQGSGANVTVPAGLSKIVYANGAGANAAVVDVTNTLSGNLTGSLTGNATTATTLQTARTIGGVSFNGAANIDLPGVNTTGNQNTIGNAAGLTGLTATVTELNVLDGVTATTAELNTLDGVNPTGPGFGYVPSGGIIMWSGSVASVPAGWFLCNGANGTPDLRNRFVVGAGDTYAVAATGGATSVTLNEAQLPAHTHGDGTLTTASAGAHQHTIPTTLGVFGSGGGVDGGPNFPYLVDSLTGSAGEHTHDITGSTGSTGSGEAVATLPPYYALAYIMKA